MGRGRSEPFVVVVPADQVRPANWETCGGQCRALNFKQPTQQDPAVYEQRHHSQETDLMVTARQFRAE